MIINNEQARLNYLPESRLYAWLDDLYTDELEFRVDGNPHEVTAAELIAELESDRFDPLDNDWDGPEDSVLTSLWADLAYPLPEEADEMAHSCYGITPSDIAREALREYAGMFEIEPVAERVLKALRDEWDEEQNDD